ncbi:DUF3375 domain-containing protein [Nocardioides sp. ChNu-153]|uniref:DUF3375 domain-containing protein n=1 Tax=unclassified Nocardioides TaxID=2615069 RepID=UPI0024065BF9|nr:MULTISPECIES: DUF3375 domain-containing protein [unclassified Nocardioides]MDF9716710.1 DUF3375 domain-containing protein [Nocardioides sp. ChNu-99]MDN7121141.1 DUF3375 domain-containing protein [Nocardioides sp. ChNu-153]
MSDIVDELARTGEAFEQPTLRLLHQRHAPLVLAVFRSSFGRDNAPIPTGRLHEQVETYLAELRLAGTENLPTGSGRDLCLRWMRRKWLIRANDPATDGEVYTLTSYAQAALEQARTLSRERSSLSEHRVANIVSAFRRFNSEANPDRTTRVTILNQEIARLRAERDRLVDGSELPVAGEDYMLQGFTELLSLVGGLPSDFARVEEAFVRIRHDIHEQFRADERPAGEVVDDYLARIDQLTTATPEGRAFEGAFPLLRDEALLQQLREDIADLLDHPVTGTVLGDTERREIRDTVKQVRAGLDRVLAQRNRATATLRGNIEARDVNRDRELERVLRNLEGELGRWYAATGPRTHVGLPLLPERAAVDHLRERTYDPTEDKAPPPLRRADADGAEAVSWTALRAAGGPSIAELDALLDAALAGGGGAATVGELFASLEDDLRRPVEVFGLLHLAERRALADGEGTEEVVTVRPDGSRRVLRVPRVRTVPRPPAVPPAVPPADPATTPAGDDR